MSQTLDLVVLPLTNLLSLRWSNDVPLNATPVLKRLLQKHCRLEDFRRQVQVNFASYPRYSGDTLIIPAAPDLLEVFEKADAFRVIGKYWYTDIQHIIRALLDVPASKMGECLQAAGGSREKLEEARLKIAPVDSLVVEWK